MVVVKVKCQNMIEKQCFFRIHCWLYSFDCKNITYSIRCTLLSSTFLLISSGQQNLAVPGAHTSRPPSTTITTRSTARSPRASPSPARASSTSRVPRSPSRGRPIETRKVSQRKPSSQRPYTGDVPTIKTEETDAEDTMAASRKSHGRSMNVLNRSISADPNLNDPKVQAKIGNRMTKTINKTIGEYTYRYLYHIVKVLQT